MTHLLVLAFVSAAVAGAVAGVAWRARALDRGGAVAAAGVGGVVLAGGGLRWAVVLVAFFGAAGALSAFGSGIKAVRLRERAPGAGSRRARQVLANGLWAALAATGAALWPTAAWSPLFFGSLAAASADTWATEIGVLARRAPRSIRTGRRVPVGTSGGVTWLGSASALAGAAFVAAVGLALGSLGRGGAWAVWIAGCGGAFADSWLGATLQARYRCDACGLLLEDRRHRACAGTPRRAGGLRLVDNDVVNLLGSGVGAGLALALT